MGAQSIVIVTVQVIKKINRIYLIKQIQKGEL